MRARARGIISSQALIHLCDDEIAIPYESGLNSDSEPNKPPHVENLRAGKLDLRHQISKNRKMLIFVILRFRDLSSCSASASKNREEPPLSPKWGSTVAFIGHVISDFPHFELWMRLFDPDRELLNSSSKGSSYRLSRRKTLNRTPWRLGQVLRPPNRKKEEKNQKKCIFLKKLIFGLDLFDFDPKISHFDPQNGSFQEVNFRLKSLWDCLNERFFHFLIARWKKWVTCDSFFQKGQKMGHFWPLI